MSKFDEQLNRMQYLCDYQPETLNESKNNNVEFFTVGADENVYGIIKEGNKYYIKRTERGRENLAESYNYINGFNRKNENCFNSYNTASKHLEVMMINLNEAHGRHEDVSVVDFSKAERDAQILNEAARVELDRMKQIMENIDIISNIGDHGNPESKGTSTGAQTEKNNTPFDSKVSPKMDKDHKFKGTVEGATSDFNKVSHETVNKDLQSDKMKSANSNETENGCDKNYKNTKSDLEGTDVVSANPTGAKAVKMNENVDIETLLEELQNDEVLKGPKGNGQSVAMADSQIKAKVEKPSEKALKGPNGSMKAISWDKMTNEDVDALADVICESIIASSKQETLLEMVDRVVNEEVTKLNVFGQHPGYRKKPFTTDPNKEVLAGTADRDWNDESAKGDSPFGQKIGSSAPFTEPIDGITNAVVNMVKETLLKKK